MEEGLGGGLIIIYYIYVSNCENGYMQKLLLFLRMHVLKIYL